MQVALSSGEQSLDIVDWKGNPACGDLGVAPEAAVRLVRPAGRRGGDPGYYKGGHAEGGHPAEERLRA